MHQTEEGSTHRRSDTHHQLVSAMQAVADKSCRKKLAGIALGVIVEGKTLGVCSGWADEEWKVPVTETTVFEVGSLSKLFTSQLLALTVNKQELDLDDPVQSVFEGRVVLPTDGNREITFRTLANHRSSLPRLPDDLIATADGKNPYAHYDQDMIYACLERMDGLPPIGCRTRYSNFGVGLLGHALGKLAGSDYHQLLKQRVLVPLDMKQTYSQCGEEDPSELAKAYQKKHHPTQHWDFQEVTTAAGGIRSSLADMFRFLRSHLDPESKEMRDAIELMRQPSPPTPEDCRTSESTKWLFPIGVVGALAGFMSIAFGKDWWMNGGPDGLGSFLSLIVPSYGASILWGWYPGVFALTGMASLATWLWGSPLELVPVLIMAVALVGSGSIWRTAWASQSDQNLEGGQLAWQAMPLRATPTFWHNGMVGGAASFLAIVPDLEIGVIVLTNTAKSVDSIGMKVLDEVQKRQEERRQENPSNSPSTDE